MSTVLRLDASALRALILDSDDIRMEIGRGVIAEVVKNCLMPSIVKELSALTHGMVAQVVAEVRDDAIFQEAVAAKMKAMLTTSHYQPKTLTPQAKAEVELRVSAYITDLATSNLPKIAKLQGEVVSQLQAYVDGALPGLITDRIDRYSVVEVNTQVQARLDQIKGAL